MPLYPVEPDKPWEYWIYPYINDGIEVVFVSQTYQEDFDYPGLPQGGRAESSKNTVVWTQRRPETVVAAAVSRKSDVYFQMASVILVTSESADFIGDGRASCLELYFGVPLEGLKTVTPDTGTLARGVAVFSLDWKPLYRKRDTIRYLSDPERPGQVAASESALTLPPGSYQIGSEFRDVGGDAFGARYDTITVEP